MTLSLATSILTYHLVFSPVFFVLIFFLLSKTQSWSGHLKACSQEFLWLCQHSSIPLAEILTDPWCSFVIREQVYSCSLSTGEVCGRWGLNLPQQNLLAETSIMLNLSVNTPEYHMAPIPPSVNLPCDTYMNIFGGTVYLTCSVPWNLIYLVLYIYLCI